MTTLDADVLIVGAGCAGLSLAVHLLEAGHDGGVVLVDPRTEFGADRTWCFFDVVPHPFEDAVTRRWARWEVCGPGGVRVERSLEGVHYCHLPSERFYAAALRTLEGRVRLVLGEGVTSLVDEGDSVVARTTKGTAVRARRAFDSRPAAPRTGRDDHVRLVQHFVGHVVETDGDVFDPDVVTLMDFDTSQAVGPHFVYVLPFGARSALVESTTFATRVPAVRAHEDAIDSHLRSRRGVRAWRVVGREEGAIPMTTAPFPARPSRRVYAIGLAGGVAKPSTGYAFLAIQRFSAELARRLVREELPPAPAPRAVRSEVLDTVFLSFLDRHADAAPTLFPGLFARTEPGALVRFLSDAGSPADDLRVIAAVRDPRLAVELARTRRLWQPRLRRSRDQAR